MLSFIAGLFIGTLFGIFIISILVSGKTADMRMAIYEASRGNIEPAKQFIKEGR